MTEEVIKLRKIYIYIFITIVTISILSIVGFIVWQEPLQAILHETIFELTFQFFLLIVLGGAVSLFLKEYARVLKEQEQHRLRQIKLRENQKSLQRDLYADIVEAYNSAKKVRRLIKAQALITDETAQHEHGLDSKMIQKKAYDEHMETLNDIQLQFEFFCHQVDSSPDLYADAPNLYTHLGTIEKYIGKLISEYEGSLQKFSGNPPVMELQKLPDLQEFIYRVKNSGNFNKNFKTPFHEATGELRNLIISGPKKS